MHLIKLIKTIFPCETNTLFGKAHWHANFFPLDSLPIKCQWPGEAQSAIKGEKWCKK